MAWYRNHPSECPLAWIDTETGGLDTSQAALLEVAVIVTDITGTVVRDRWAAKVLPYPDDVMDPAALAVNGYDAERWDLEAEGYVAARQSFLQRVQGAIFAGHNVPFDFAMIMRWLGRGPEFGVPALRQWIGPHWKVDTVSLAWPLLMACEVPDLKLTTLTRYLGIPHESAHTALGDAEAARLVYVALMERFKRPAATVPPVEARMGIEGSDAHLEGGRYFPGPTSTRFPSLREG